MKLIEASKMAKEMIAQFVPGCEFAGFNSRKKSCGVAIVSRCGKFQKIELSSFYVQRAEVENVRNTIAHECAHILAYRTYGTLKHDKYFYNCCKITGATQERLMSDKKVNEAMKGGYGVIIAENGKVAKVLPNSYHNRPRKDLTECWIGNDRSTKGKLFYCEMKNAVVGKNVVPGFYWQK